jgi:hypothetical protein
VTDEGRVECWTQGCDSFEPSLPNQGNYVSVVEGSSHSCALTADGEVDCWGLFSVDRECDPARPDCAGDEPFTDEVGAASHQGDYEKVAAGRNYTCALTGSGTIDCWGRQDGKQITGDRPNQGSYVELAADDFPCAVTRVGSVDCWGDTTYAAMTIEAPPAERYKQVDIDGRHICALSDHGHYDCFRAPGAGIVHSTRGALTVAP